MLNGWIDPPVSGTASTKAADVTPGNARIPSRVRSKNWLA